MVNIENGPIKAPKQYILIQKNAREKFTTSCCRYKEYINSDLTGKSAIETKTYVYVIHAC